MLESSLAGMWYSSSPEDLEEEVRQYLSDAPCVDLGPVIALLLPHAGYVYSGRTAARALAQVVGRQFERVVVLGPTHQYAMRNIVSLPTSTHYATPLGEVEIDQDFAQKLRAHSFVVSDPSFHRQEHSVQIEIPLLQVALKDFKLVPIVVGQLDLETAFRVGASLRELIDDDTLLVVSSDFTHYGARFGYVPFHDDVAERIRRLDMGAYHFIEKLDPRGFMQYCDETGATICGQIPIAVLLAMLPNSARAHLMQYETSGGMNGGYDASVSYLSAAFTGSWSAPAESSEPLDNEKNSSSELGEADQQNLLRLARAVIERYLCNGRRPADDEMIISAGMRRWMGAFVTLKKHGDLRGCIGEIFPRRELYKAVIDHAVNAAANDHRFGPVATEELDDIKIEISALTPPHAVDSYREIEIGRHGVLLEKGLRASVFLPQVAPEQGWDLEEMLRNLALKAGLGPDDWRAGAEFKVFEAIVFGEE